MMKLSKYIKVITELTAYIFTAESLVLTILMQFGIFGRFYMHEGVPALLLMALSTAVYVTLCGRFLPDIPWIHKITEPLGCMIIVFAIGMLTGWFSLSWQFLIAISAMVIVIYVIVWGTFTLINLKNAKELNQKLLRLKK